MSIFMHKISKVLQKAIQEGENNTSDGVAGDGGADVCFVLVFFQAQVGAQC